jgi:hypothetical protein
VGVFFFVLGYELGDGSKIRFGYDLWCGDQPLKTTLLELFCIARCKKACMADHMQFFNENH